MKTKLLFVCTANLDRSPAAESLFKDSDKYEAKSCGISPLAEIKVTKQAILWADEIFVMEPLHKRFLLENFPDELKNKPEIIILDVNNEYARNDSELEKLLRVKLVDLL